MRKQMDQTKRLEVHATLGKTSGLVVSKIIDETYGRRRKWLKWKEIECRIHGFEELKELSDSGNLHWMERKGRETETDNAYTGAKRGEGKNHELQFCLERTWLCLPTHVLNMELNMTGVVTKVSLLSQV